MSYPLKALQELCRIIIGRTPSRSEPSYWGKGNKWVSISDLDGKIVVDTKEEITDLAVESARCRRISKGTLLFSFKLTIGKMAFAGEDLFTNEAIAALEIKDPDALSASYLYYALQSAKVGGSNQAAKGKTLNSKSLAEIEIPLPSLDDQVRMAALLGKVEGLIAQRKQQLQQLDELLKSVYLEMFGPTSPDYEAWPLVEIRELAAKHKSAMRTGPFGSNLLHSEFTSEGDVAVLGIDNAVQNRFAWDERRFISREKYQELQNYRIFAGDVIVTIMGTIGRSAVIPDGIPLAINTKHLAAITLNRELAIPVFVSYSIHSNPFVQKQIAGKNRGAIMSGLNLGIIKAIKIKRPPIGLQSRFAEIHGQVDRLKSGYQKSLRDFESLYGALSQQAFKGQLDLSRILVPNGEPQGPPTILPNTSSRFADYSSTVHLPDTELLPAALDGSAQLKELLTFWLDAYRHQLDGESFCVRTFLAAAQARLAEFHPENEVELALDAYEQIKVWVFAALASGGLTQGYADADNRVTLANTTEQRTED